MATLGRPFTATALVLGLVGLASPAEAEVFYGLDAQTGFGVTEDGTATGSGSGDLADALSLLRATEEGQRIEAVLDASGVEVFIEVFPAEDVGQGAAYGTTRIVGRDENGEITNIAIRIAGTDHLGFVQLADTIHHEMRHAEEQMSDNDREVHRGLDADEDPLNMLFQEQADEIRDTVPAGADEPPASFEDFEVTIGPSLFVVTVPAEIASGDLLPFTVCSYNVASGNPREGETGFFTIGRDPAGPGASHASATLGPDGCFSDEVEVREPPGMTYVLTSDGSQAAIVGEVTIVAPDQPGPAPSEPTAVVQTFISTFAAALDSGDNAFVFSRLHPDIVEAFGEDLCRSWVQDEIMTLDAYALDGPITGPATGSLTTPSGVITFDERYSAEISFDFEGQSFSAIADYVIVDDETYFTGTCR